MTRVYSLPISHDECFHGDRGEHIPYHRMHGKEYCLPSLILYSKQEYEDLKFASIQVDRIFRKALRFVQRYLPDPMLVNQLGIHPSLIPAARIEVPFHGVSRQDWIIRNGSMKVIENNTDTPTGIPETAYLANSLLSEFSDFNNPSDKMNSSIVEAFSSLITYYQQLGFGSDIVFSCYDWHEEDLCNTLYLMHLVQQAGYSVRFAPLDKLEVRTGEGLFFEGRKIDIWYRLYPLEYLVYDQDENGFATGEEILSLISQKKLAVINPVQSIITQSKGFMAMIWSLYERREFLPEVFSDEECSVIERYFLPTYFHDEPLLIQKIPYVSKALFGREGKGTLLYDQRGIQEKVGLEDEPADSSEEDLYYLNQPRIFQKRVELEEVTVHTEEGDFRGYLLTGVYVIGGKYAGLLPRIGGKITGNLAYFAPAALKDKEA
ncbi:glutathionylspermidine synthase family protein [Ammoniphilus sp. CFH 90114]|uniref:glutathionylspermidine synthase family protein n=1 Tax=Ammoniphilus sp. CFH 90114 TaxID=2493665 RepID=UPI00100F27D3|nr:glutathionylspermidine synthase family protein [Ammoniphilus sp. CFH 90114]RXT07870.1 glutathionylspermidine synthase [Ammoniphilus sp. CFH 90114]